MSVAYFIRIKCGVVVFLLLFSSVSFAQQLKTYSSPAEAPAEILQEDYLVRVRKPGGEWKALPTYKVKINMRDPQEASMAYFDFSGKIEVSVHMKAGKVNKVRIRPESDLVSTRKGDTIYFVLSKPENLSIEFNGDIYHNLHLFANPVETNRPDSTGENVVYFGPGVHVPPGNTGMYKIKSNETVYIAGGAIVRGGFLCDSVENVKITGRGIIYQPPEGIMAKYSKNIEISGLIFVNPDHYTITSGESENVKIHNIKSFSDKGWGDGIDLFCSSNIYIDHVFMRNSDDCIAIYGHRWDYYGNTRNVRVRHSTLWADVAHPINIGTHGDVHTPDTLENIRFENIHILEQNESQIDYQGCMAINAGDKNLIRNVVFDQIQVDNFTQGQLLNLRIMYNKKYNKAPGNGIENIHFKNVSYKGENSNLSIVTGYDETRKIKNLTFTNLRINGKLIYDQMPGKPGYYKTGDMARIFIGEHVENVTFNKED